MYQNFQQLTVMVDEQMLYFELLLDHYYDYHFAKENQMNIERQAMGFFVDIHE